MSDGMEIYRAYLAARSLAERLHAAHHEKGAREYHLTAASEELEETRDKLDTAILAHIKPAPADAPAA